MAWSWSHTAEAYYHARCNLERMDREDLEIIFAEWRAAQGKGGVIEDTEYFNMKRYDRALRYAKSLPGDILVDFIWERAEQFATCDNGGWRLWMCPSGCHTVSPDCEEEEGCDCEA